MKNKNSVRDWKLERYLLGELPKDEMTAIREAAAQDEILRARIEALRESNAQILAEYPTEIMAKHIRNLAASENVVENYNAKKSWREKIILKKFAPTFAATAIVCALAIFIIPAQMRIVNQYDNGELYEDRVKGNAREITDAKIEVWRNEEGVARKLSPHDFVREGDVIQLRYVVPKRCYGAIVSVDGRGVMTVHLSDQNGGAVPLTPGAPVALRNSYELDDAPYYEVFYLVTADENFSVGDIVLAHSDGAAKSADEELTLSLSQDLEHNVMAFKLLK